MCVTSNSFNLRTIQFKPCFFFISSLILFPSFSQKLKVRLKDILPRNMFLFSFACPDVCLSQKLPNYIFINMTECTLKRQLHATSYMTKLVRLYLCIVCVTIKDTNQAAESGDMTRSRRLFNACLPRIINYVKCFVWLLNQRILLIQITKLESMNRED